MRLIDAEPIKIRYNTETLGRREMYEIVKNAPTIDAEPVRHGRWVNRYKSDAPPTLKERWICSWCGDVQTYGETRYCPNCGARMDGGENE